MSDQSEDDSQWAEFMEEVYAAVVGKMNDTHMKMVFALNMICEFCKRDADLNMTEIHKMALFGLGYDHEEDDSN